MNKKVEFVARQGGAMSHDAAILAYDRANRALQDATNLVGYLEGERDRLLALCQSFIPTEETPTP